MWKPLLRQFRRYYKQLSKKAISHQTYAASMDTDRVNSTSQGLSEDESQKVSRISTKNSKELFGHCLPILECPIKVLERAYLHYDNLALPIALRNDRNALAILLVVESHRITQFRQILPAYKTALRPYSADIMNNFLFIFNENSKRSRLCYFKD